VAEEVTPVLADRVAMVDREERAVRKQSLTAMAEMQDKRVDPDLREVPGKQGQTVRSVILWWAASPISSFKTTCGLSNRGVMTQSRNEFW